MRGRILRRFAPQNDSFGGLSGATRFTTRKDAMPRIALAALLAAFASLALPSSAGAADGATPGALTQEVPTFHCLGVRWVIEGDDNKNASIRLGYRKKGANDWKRALDLFRVETSALQGVAVPAGSQLFAGSVFDLDENTDYELKLTLSDPDGGAATQTVSAKTWTEPLMTKPRRTLHVAPGAGAGAGTAANPYKGLAAADAAAQPGDLILVHRGAYSGTWTMTASGTANAPICWRGAGDGEAVIDGGGAARAISANSVKNVMLEGLTITHATWGIVAHGASDFTVRRCKFTSETGLSAHQADQRHIIILDCTMQGPCTWPRTKGIEEPEGFEVQGEGNIIAYNRIAGVADGISIFRGPSHANDFYNNDISECTDDGIEMDYGGQNNRCFRNRLTNCFQGISVQPLFGGPCYIFRNTMYNTELETFKMHNNPSGFLVYHNTSVKAGMPLILATSAKVRRAIFRNNLFIGTADKYAFEIMPPMEECDWDYDGFGGGPWGNFAKWNGKIYPTFEALRDGSGIEKHAVLVDPKTCFATGVLPPGTCKTQFPPATNDLRPKAGSDAVDKGEPLPNINDGFRDKAPDLGACELGDPLPQYGPRPLP